MTVTQTQAAKTSASVLNTFPLSNGDGFTKPLMPLGLWDKHKQQEITPLIGTVFDEVNLAEVLRSPDCDAKIGDLAVLISRRGLCVFPKQTELSVADQKLLCRKLGQLSTRPYTSDLWIHPVNQTRLPDGTLDGEVMSPSRDPKKKLYTKVSPQMFSRLQVLCSFGVYLPHGCWNE